MKQNIEQLSLTKEKNDITIMHGSTIINTQSPTQNSASHCPQFLPKHINSQNTQRAGMKSTISVNPQESIVQFNMPTVNTFLSSLTQQNGTLIARIHKGQV